MFFEGTSTQEKNEILDDPVSSFGGLMDMLFGNLDETEEDEDMDGEEVEAESEVPCGLHDASVPFSQGPSVTIEVTSSGAMGGGDDDYEIEEDPELLMAVYDALSTPATVEAEDDAVLAVVNVQEQCAVDFDKLCIEDEATSVEFARMPSLGNDIASIFDSMRGTFMESDQPSGNLLYFRRRLMETEHEHKKLEQYSDGLKLMRQLRDSVVPMDLFRAPDAARR